MSEIIDPTRATSPAINRRVFSMFAGAGALAATTAAGLAIGEDFGKPHDPIVPENDPAIAVGRPQFHSGTRLVDSYYASPKTAGPSTPAIVIAMHVWGVDAQIRDTARRLAKAGYIAIVPDLYSGLGAPTGDGISDIDVFRPFAGKLNDDQVDADLAAAVGFIRGGSGGAVQKIGVLGFCMGGSIALRQTVDAPKLFSAAAVFYGKIRYSTTSATEGAITPIALAYADEIAIPLVGSFGARDTGIPSADVTALEARLTTLKKPHDLRVYESAGHAFFDDTRSSYVAAAAGDAWTRTLTWFSTYLK